MHKIIAAIGAALTAVALLYAAGNATATPANDCDRVAAADRKLCRIVRAQHAYAFPTETGITEVASGKAIVHEITHGGLSKTEMHAGLSAATAGYQLHVTAVPVSMDWLVKRCGNTDGRWIVGYRDADGKPGGVKITVVRADCS